jgi:hypothetical protein
MKHIWANQGKEWEGFRPTAYTLDAQRVWNLPLTRVKRTSSGEKEAAPVTLGEVLDSLAGQQIGEINPLAQTRVITDTGEVVFDGAPFNCKMLEVLFELRRDGANGFEADWFWYDSDSVTDDPHESYSFFVVDNDRIVKERISFSDYHGSEFDPSLFKVDNESCPIWSGDEGRREGSIRFWYRKFYRETRAGQLMVLRSDEPELYHYPEGRWRPDLALGFLQDRLSKIYSLLWILVLLALLALILLWR